ncbi:SDR family oxidoreductase [Marinobacter sp. SS21]|uniref:SDR family oxidoreductase n=1 Tax=Marinobacter sp. SS21 TaxID=2979460 RepID=UPI00232ADF3D|nr:SDR family oxidoreductase [Marinobacter sp. SS21]MDC0661624.1 SDR family oxidoreductase [Marinobacter sp. SS21]
MKTILITGAASGIGAATARKFAREGWRLGLLDVNGAALSSLNESLGGQHWTCEVDVTDGQSVEKALAEFTRFSKGQLDLLFNCAGILRIGHFEQISVEDHARIIDINVTGLIRMCRAAFPLLKQTPGARVINMSSASAMYGTPHFASYSASKFAVRGLTEALNIEWKAHDILVQDIMTPFVKTPMVDSQSFKAPVIERLGVNLSADNLADEVWQTSQTEDVHHLVGLQFKSLALASKWLPNIFTRGIMAALSH